MYIIKMALFGASELVPQKGRGCLINICRCLVEMLRTPFLEGCTVMYTMWFELETYGTLTTKSLEIPKISCVVTQKTTVRVFDLDPFVGRVFHL